MNDLISSLDNALASQDGGEDITLRRVVGAGANIVNVDCSGVRAKVSYLSPQQLIGGLSQTDSIVTISPTQILQKQWPPVPLASAQFPLYPWLPQPNNKAVIQGRIRNVSAVKPFIVDNEVVRIEMTVAG